ncbi:MAG: TAXI family TRAP transporter solute-binding subunit [Peptococcaceae bacterium]|nr:TAXI family TRAP transporter solute-binding subunit [Peptococcaceae bacterium]
MKKRNKLISLICICVSLLMMVLSACGQNTANQTPAPQGQPDNGAAAAADPLKVTFAGSSPGGVWYMVMGGVTESINKSYPGSSVTVIPGDGVSNIVRVAGNQAEIGLSHSAIAASAISGDDPFDKTIDNIATAASLYPSQLQFVVTAKSGVQSIQQIMDEKMKIRISVDGPGSTGELAFRRMINEYGFTYDDIISWGGQVVYKNMGDSSDMLSDGLLDGMSTMTLYPASPITEAAINNDMVMLPVDPKICEALAQKYGYGTDGVPEGTYDFQTGEISTISSYTVICVPKNAPDETVYAIAKSIHENLDYLKSVHVAMNTLTPEKLVENLGAPLHPGAEKYYKEVGVLK